MEHASLLDGWLALAAETRRVDRISAALGLDSPALQNSPSSLGSSCGSSGLNTPSQNAFRILPFLNDISPEFLNATSIKAKNSSSTRPHPQSKTNNNRHNPLSAHGRRPSASNPSRPLGRGGLSTSSVPTAPSLAVSRKESPTPYDSTLRRPPLANNRNVSYPTWPAPKPVNPSSIPSEMNGVGRQVQGSPYPPSFESRDLRSPFQPKSLNGKSSPNLFPPIQDSYSPQRSVRHYSYQYASRPVAITDAVSPMLSEPFHRLIVKDEEEMIDLSSMPPTTSDRGAHGGRGGYHDNTSQVSSHVPRPRKENNINMVTEDEEEASGKKKNNRRRKREEGEGEEGIRTTQKEKEKAQVYDNLYQEEQDEVNGFIRGRIGWDKGQSKRDGVVKECELMTREHVSGPSQTENQKGSPLTACRRKSLHRSIYGISYPARVTRHRCAMTEKRHLAARDTSCGRFVGAQGYVSALQEYAASIPVGGRAKTEGMVDIEETVEYRLICQERAQGWVGGWDSQGLVGWSIRRRKMKTSKS
ncbi:15555_t:CDS:2 [Acaulospora colombiana]|uniref:15555_t:CDS:1 n=1 Tax=Acaulospora colombiana TaxID=27376 RepID=A0ACA9MMD2_9GLOM|nr:15555_t:CDS:2 [Acaulospora colombiana]